MRLDRLVFILSAVVLSAVAVFMAGMYSGHKKTFVFRWINQGYADLKGFYATFRESSLPLSHLGPHRGRGEGVTAGAGITDGKLIFLSGFFGNSNALRLIRRDGSVVAEWPVDYFTLFPDRSYKPGAPVKSILSDIHGAEIHPNGDVAFNFEYLGTVKMDRCGTVLWTRASQTHHSLEIAPDGGYWVLDRRTTPGDDLSYSPLAGRYAEDLAEKLSADGEVEWSFSIPRMQFDGGMKAILTTSFRTQNDREYRDRELIHANRLTMLRPEMAAAFPMFAAGDLLISDKFSNAIAVHDGKTGALKWFQVGPFLQQHDAEFRADGKITLFNNNAFDDAEYQYGSPAETHLSNIMAVDPATGATEVIYGDREGEQLFSIIRGHHQSLPGGGILITEFSGGRVLEVDAERKTVWEFVNAYDPDYVAEVTGATLLPESYFTVADWTCPARG